MKYCYLALLCSCLAISYAEDVVISPSDNNQEAPIVYEEEQPTPDLKVAEALKALILHSGAQWTIKNYSSTYGRKQFSLVWGGCRKNSSIAKLKTFRVPTNDELKQRAQDFFIKNPNFFEANAEFQPIGGVMDMMAVYLSNFLI